MEKLQQELDRLIATLPNADAFRASLDRLVSVYPFNDYVSSSITSFTLTSFTLTVFV